MSGGCGGHGCCLVHLMGSQNVKKKNGSKIEEKITNDCLKVADDPLVVGVIRMKNVYQSKYRLRVKLFKKI